MIPVLIGLAAAAAATAAGTAVYKYFFDEDTKPSAVDSVKRLGSFAIWGRPNVGKTTFVAGLLGEKPSPRKKTATTSRTVYRDVKLDKLNGGIFLIDEIVDMPGTGDRLSDWLNLVAEKNHIFYMIDLSRADNQQYIYGVKEDVQATVKALRDSKKTIKKIHIIASHVDESKWKNVDAAHINNELQDDDEIRLLYESIDDVSGYVYSADLTDDVSLKRLLQSIVDDCKN